ncbi:hypothetical protein HU200_049654 [Digitaria exilis]|uniref:N-acetyltransferase domain-containing protein n=1 Tax=Digitaria exilis TaxID=1010633 RepID=A0A835AZM3_9POAL|nr:hypothetical protein HU200_049654 [Digitaria exilis]
MAAAAAIHELDPSDERSGRIIDNIVRLERRIFPKHESLARSIHEELKRRNSGLIYMTSSAAGGDGDEVVGYAMYTIPTSLCASITKLAGENTSRAFCELRFCLVSSLNVSAKTVHKTATSCAVKESCRRQGHGEALLAAAMARCRRRKVQRVSLHVDPARTAAVALYRKVGFQVDATVVGYYAPQRDAYRMYIDLDP